MSRNRFRWDAVRQPLLRRLARALALEGEPAEALRDTYGQQPREDFVRDTWPILLKAWLPKDGAHRADVVEQLRARRLGDRNLPVRTRADQLAYLATCRNAAGLRSVVADAFGDLGRLAEPRRCGVPHQSEMADEVRGTWDDDLDVAWSDYLTWLEDSLTLHQYGPISIRLPESNVDLGTGPQPLSVAIPIDRRPRRSAIARFDASVQVGPTTYRFGRFQDELITHGWEEADGEWRWDAGAGQTPDLARALVATLRAVGVIHPAFLCHTGTWPGDEEAEAPSHLAIYDVRDPHEMDRRVEEALAPYLNGPVERDADRDIALPRNGTTIYIRVARNAAGITLFMPVMHHAENNTRTLKRLNKLNREWPSLKFSLRHGVVVAAIELWCWPFVPVLLRQAVDAMIRVAEQGDELRQVLGGPPF